MQTIESKEKDKAKKNEKLNTILYKFVLSFLPETDSNFRTSETPSEPKIINKLDQRKIRLYWANSLLLSAKVKKESKK